MIKYHKTTLSYEIRKLDAMRLVRRVYCLTEILIRQRWQATSVVTEPSTVFRGQRVL